MKKPKLKTPNLKKLKEKLERSNEDPAESSGRFKYKAKGLLDKTKDLLKGLEKDEEDFTLSENDLSELQSDLADLMADIKQKPIKEETSHWEEIKTLKSRTKTIVVEEIIKSPYEYWISEFGSVFSFFLKNHEIKDILFFIRNEEKMKNPLLSRLFRKIKETIFENQPIILLSEVIEE